MRLDPMLCARGKAHYPPSTQLTSCFTLKEADVPLECLA